ncbi:Organic cation transporter-like protein, partial [Euroglyphus maynei]
YFESTLVTDFQLYCDQKWFLQLVQVAYFYGNLLGAITNGILADKFGRRFIFQIYSPITVACILMCSLTPNVWLYGIGTFLKGASVAGIYQSAFAITMECLGGKWRFWLGMLTSLSFTSGAIYTCMFAWWFRRWRLIEFINLLPALIMLTYPFLIPESIRWQYSSGQCAQAMDQIMAAAKKNRNKTTTLNKEMIDVFITQKSKEKEEKKG